MRFASLGSGSRGNALVVEVGGTRVMLDCGFAVRETVTRLARLGVEPESIDAIVVTHEHSDHAAGVFKFARRYAKPVWMTHGTSAAFPRDKVQEPEIRLFDSHAPFAVGALEVSPFPVPHDAREPSQFVFSDGMGRLGVLTDAGFATQHIVDMLDGCDALVLECNHDAAMLAASDYPYSLKQRIAGRFGHLDNTAAAGLLAALDASKLRHLIAAHLSEQNNTPDLARAALASVLGCAPEWIGVASQEAGLDWRDVG